jgi:hypothetical protein
MATSNALAPTPQNALAMPTAKELFLQRQNTDWAKPYGGVVPYYPQQRYITENLAPDLGITRSQLEALAQANQTAIKSGLMSPALAAKMLPTLLTENATGIKSWGYADTPKYRDILTKAGLPPTLKEINAMKLSDDYDLEVRNAKLMHAMMAAKAQNYGEDKAIERWNGQGTAKGGYANAANHARKVTELETLLQHPKNAEMMAEWAYLSARHAGKPPDVVKPTPENEMPLSWADKNLPGLLSAPINALSESIPNNLVDRAQRAIRNWTAQ